MWDDVRALEYFKVGGVWAVVFGLLAVCYGWYFFDLSDPALWLCGAAGWFAWSSLQWKDSAANGLWRIEEKMDALEEKLDDIESMIDNPKDQPLDTDL